MKARRANKLALQDAPILAALETHSQREVAKMFGKTTQAIGWVRKRAGVQTQDIEPSARKRVNREEWVRAIEAACGRLAVAAQTMGVSRSRASQIVREQELLDVVNSARMSRTKPHQPVPRIDMERWLQAISASRGNVRAIAAAMGISPQRVYQIIRACDLSRVVTAARGQHVPN